MPNRDHRGVQPHLRQDAITSLTDSSGGTADNTIEALPASQATPSGMTSAERTAISNNFADLAAKIEEALDALRAAGLLDS